MPDARDAEDTRLLDAQDYPRLLATYYRVVVERCRLRLPDADAYEVAHNVMERLLRELTAGKRYPVPFRVVVHQVTTWKIKEFQTRGRVELLPEDWDPPSGDDPFEPFEQGHDLLALFAGLPARVREVMELRYLEGLEIGEIARRLGISRNAVDQALHRGHATIRESVG
ncbi:MAG TPA: sigma-70 family RNA polymerase sigma factor [Gaiellaceae bacterium]|nr:sigma-70 family RNA polymerase sigma factor [Gaiellaceae bacterium]